MEEVKKLRSKKNYKEVKELRNYNRKLFLCPQQKHVKTQPAF